MIAEPVEAPRRSDVKMPVAEPIFRSVHGALKFALNYTHGSLKQSSLAQMMCDRGGGGRGLGGLDGAAQAGMIRAELERLAPLRKQLLTARHVSPTEPCSCRAPCCRGWRENSEWKQAVDYLTEYVLVAGLSGMVSHFRLRRLLVCRYFGAGQTFTSIAATCGVDRDTASGYNKRIFEAFRDEERKALYEIEGQLKHAGIIET